MTLPPFEASKEWALRADRADPLAWCRDQFVLPAAPDGQPLVYFCGNSLGAMPKAAQTRLDHEMRVWSRLGVEGYFEGAEPWYAYSLRLREPLARVLGARPEEVVVMNALTVNLHLLLVTFFQPTADRHRILIEQAAFPSDAYAASSHLHTRGLGPDALLIAEPRSGEATLRIEDLDQLLEKRGREIAILWLGAVHYYTGQFHDLARIVASAHRAGCLVGFDLAHAVGNVELRLHDWDVDFAVWCSYKYLNGGPGAIGGAFIHERHARNTALPRFGGWWGNDPDTRFEMQSHPDFVPVAETAGWQISSPPVLAMAPLVASLGLFDQAGMAALRNKAVRLTGFLEYLIDRQGGTLRVITPRDPAARGCQLSIQVPEAARIVADLRTRGVITDFRDPDVLRAAPVPMYNTYHEVWRFAQILNELVRP